jgi:hypothetical protein
LLSRGSLFVWRLNDFTEPIVGYFRSGLMFSGISIKLKKQKEGER